MLDGLLHKNDAWVSCEAVDFDADGNDEAILENTHLSLFLSAADGGTLVEWDYKDKPLQPRKRPHQARRALPRRVARGKRRRRTRSGRRSQHS